VPPIAKLDNINNANEDGRHGGLEEVALLAGYNTIGEANL